MSKVSTFKSYISVKHGMLSKINVNLAMFGVDTEVDVIEKCNDIDDSDTTCVNNVIANSGQTDVVDSDQFMHKY